MTYDAAANLGVEGITVFGMPPVPFIELVAELGCRHVSMNLNEQNYNPFGFERYSLAKDKQLRCDIKAALQATGVSIALGENLTVMGDKSMSDQWEAMLEAFADLGVTRANSVTFCQDKTRNIEQYHELAELSQAYGVRPLIEFVPIFGIATLKDAVDVVRAVNHPNLGLIIDTMHTGRTGVTVNELKAVPPEYIGYIQICDVPAGKAHYDFMDAGYMEEAMFERLVPGDGAMPIREHLAALPQNRIVSIEVPQRSLAEQGVPLRESVGRCVAASKDILQDVFV